MSLYEKYVLPKFLNCACGSKPVARQREKVVPLAEGKVLEIGIGSGLNLPFYDKTKVDEIWGLDPSEELSEMARAVAIQEGMEVNFISSGAEEIPLPDDHFDSVLITYTMCTIPEVIRANTEIRRVLKNQGKMIFCEHGAAPDDNIRKWQKRINPFWGKIAGGCNIDRNIPSLIQDSGFDIIEIEEMYLPNTPKIAGYNFWGYAVSR
ncbi:class I SAM-dependent methyltransferase [Gammaproteobacteria bacterium]|nr:class I SAM-dependent methyltransferase [Gammaproteobacteria bacterium]MDC0509076.1 class I SAM-dependent methyltransferase [Gammaproteobacteria bacterium]MDC0591113.1 class I SAM-dependent methyltransferase [Gammaproteobacteria bacterium]|tara:strand:+ start:642 stop:1262 length:621 start_codon:yes stop_codon:yes gene_type:complete